MSKHLFGAIVTPHGIAANNRGESEGNLTTLQKILWNGEVHSTVSAEAIRWAIRANWQDRGYDVNRKWDENTRRHSWQDMDFEQGGEPYIDDDVLGYMSAQAAKEEASEGESEERSPGRRQRRRGKALVRRSRFEVTRAISLSPWAGDVVFSVAGIGATPSASRSGTDPVPYSGEIHATRYQYAFALTPEHLFDKRRAGALIDAIIDLGDVAGNQARYLYDFAPDAVIFRWTDDYAPRILYPFQLDVAGRLAVPELLRRVRANDVSASELVIGGSLADTGDGEELRKLGAIVSSGVKQAAQDIKQRLTEILGA